MRSHRHRLSIALTAAACVVALVGCGTSGKPAASTANQNAQEIKFADCMRSNGVPSFPDPSTNPHINFIGPGAGVTAQSPAFQSAQKACAKLEPGAGGGPPTMNASQRLKAVAFAKCMRKHGLPDFPDPTLGSASGSAPTLFLRGMTFQFGPGLNPSSPAFRRAAVTCGLHVR